MNLEKVIFGFFVLLAATLNMGFFIGDIGRAELHNKYELFAALAVSLIATVLKFGDRTQIGAVHLATSLVADLQLIAASIVRGRSPTGLMLSAPSPSTIRSEAAFPCPVKTETFITVSGGISPAERAFASTSSTPSSQTRIPRNPQSNRRR